MSVGAHILYVEVVERLLIISGIGGSILNNFWV
jgi:hypothetical protein